MAWNRFLIAPYKSGLRKDLSPFMIPDDAFVRLKNAYVFRGRVRKRFGSQYAGQDALTSRLRINLGMTATGLSGTVPGAVYKVGQVFSVGDSVFTVSQTGTPADMSVAGVGSGTYNTSTGAFTISGVDDGLTVFFYPSEPVLGFSHYEKGPVNEHVSYVMDTQFVYRFDGTGFTQNGPGASTATYLHSDNTQYFWSTNWLGATPDAIAMFITNFNATVGTPGANDDPIYYYNGSTWGNFSTNAKFNEDEDIIYTAKIMIPFKNRLLLLNTIEQNEAGTLNKAHTNRVRYSHNGSPLADSAWLERNNVFGTTKATGGGYIDAPTEEEIVSAAIIRDRLIVYFERSTYELVYTRNETSPFTWQSLNTTLGSEATFSTVSFDKSILTVGTTGIHACNGANVSRIDQEIPDEVYNSLKNTDGTKIVSGIKDYFTEMVYWTYRNNASSESNFFQDKVLVYNYANGTWAINDDCLTTFGYFEQGSNKTWQDLHEEWQSLHVPWDSFYLQANSRSVIAGTQQGMVLKINTQLSTNEFANYITKITYDAGDHTLVINSQYHNLLVDDYVKIRLADNSGDIDYGEDDIFRVYERVDEHNFKIQIPATAGTGEYLGNGYFSRVSRIDIQSKDWNPFLNKGYAVLVGKLSFLVDRTVHGEILVNYSTSSTDLDMVDQAQDNLCELGDNILETSPYPMINLEQYQERLWHGIYFQAEGDFFSINLTHSDEQMLDEDVVESWFTLHGVILYVKPITRQGL